MNPINPIIEQKINAARTEVEAAPIVSERKDGLQGMLDHAQACANGTPNKLEAIAEAMSFLIVHIVRSETREIHRINDAIAGHATACRLARVPKTAKDVAIYMAAQYPLWTIIGIAWAVERGYIGKIVDVVLK